jgi:hypothetical protein
VLGTESNVCGSLFFDGEEQGVTSATGALCFDRAAGTYPIRWFIDAPAAGLSDSVRVSYCLGGAADCQPTQAVPQAMLRPTIGAADPGAHCSVHADCDDGLACLQRRGGICVDRYTPIRDCDVNTDCTSGLLCSQRGECTPPDESCLDNADCMPNWLCTSAHACVPKTCDSLDPSENPCLKPENFGQRRASMRGPFMRRQRIRRRLRHLPRRKFVRERELRRRAECGDRTRAARAAGSAVN